MNDRYFGKVVSTTDKFTIVMNKGSNDGVKVNDKFLVVGLGQTIIDPDTQEELGRLEIVRGKVSVIHVQERMSTAKAFELERTSDKKEIKKVTSHGNAGIASIFGSQDTVTESITPGVEKIKELDRAEIGDLLLRV